MYTDKRYRFTKTLNSEMTDDAEAPDSSPPAATTPAKSDGDSCDAGIIQKVRDFCSRFTEPDQRKNCEEEKSQEMCSNESKNPCDDVLSTNPFLNFLRQMRKDNASLTVVEIAKQGGTQWNSMSYEEKMPFYAMAYWARKCHRKRTKACKSVSTHSKMKKKHLGSKRSKKKCRK